MATKGDDAPASASTAPLSQAADRLRDSARWLVVAFGAVAAVVFTGIGVSRFGDLDPRLAPGLFAIAALSALLAVVGALGAMVVAMSLAAASTLSVADLLDNDPDTSVTSAKNTLAKAPLLAPWGGDFKDFFDEVNDANRQHQIQLKSWAENDDLDPTPNLVNRAAQRVEALDGLQSAVLEAASYLRLRKRFEVARWWLSGWLLLAAVCSVAFVIATGNATVERVPLEPSTAVWSVPADDQDRIGSLLGNSCAYELDAVPVVIIDERGDGKEVELVTDATNDCDPVRIFVPIDDVRRQPD